MFSKEQKIKVIQDKIDAILQEHGKPSFESTLNSSVANIALSEESLFNKNIVISAKYSNLLEIPITVRSRSGTENRDEESGSLLKSCKIFPN